MSDELKESIDRRPARTDSTTERQALWIASILITAAAAGGVAGLLAHSDGYAVQAAALVGGGSFTSTALLLISIVRFAKDRYR